MIEPDRKLEENFYCPLCGSNHYTYVTVTSEKTKGAPRVVHGLFACAGCTVVFRDPISFTALTRDSIVNGPRRRERMATREYPPDAVTVKDFE